MNPQDASTTFKVPGPVHTAHDDNPCIDRLGSTDNFHAPLEKLLLPSADDDMSSLMRASSLEGILNGVGTSQCFEDLLHDELCWPRSSEATNAAQATILPSAMSPADLKPALGPAEPAPTSKEEAGPAPANQRPAYPPGMEGSFRASPYKSHAHMQQGRAPPSMIHMHPARISDGCIGDFHHGSSPHTAQDAMQGIDQQLPHRMIPTMPITQGEDASDNPLEPAALHKRLRVRTMRDVCSSPVGTSRCNSADDSFTAAPGRSSCTPRQGYSAVGSPANSPNALGKGPGPDFFHSPNRLGSRPTAYDHSSSPRPQSDPVPGSPALKNVNDMQREAVRLEQLNDVLHQQLNGLVEQIEQFQKENEVLRMVLAQVCRMRGDTPEAWNELVMRLRQPTPMLSDSHAMQMAASALSASQGNAFVALQKLLDTAMNKMKGR